MNALKTQRDMAVIGFSLETSTSSHFAKSSATLWTYTDWPIRFSYIAHLVLVGIDLLVLSYGLSFLKIPQNFPLLLIPKAFIISNLE